MSDYNVPRDLEAIVYALVKAHNELHAATVGSMVSSGSFSLQGTTQPGTAFVTASYQHRSISGMPPSANYQFPSSSNLRCLTTASAGSVVSSCASVNEIAAVIKQHFLDDSAHLAVDTGAYSRIQSLTASNNLASANTLLSQSLLAFNNHLTSTLCHLRADATNPITGVFGSSQGNLDFFVNQMLPKVNAHIVLGPTAARIKIVD